MAEGDTEKMWSILDLLNWTTKFFEKKGIEAPRLQAELLLAHVMKRERIQLYARFDEVPDEQTRASFRELIKKRAAHCPVQYLLGKTEFLSREFAVDSRALIPRPETEQLVEMAIERLRNSDLLDKGPVVDLGTGSGVIAVNLALSLAGVDLIATDISSEALDLARQNAKRHGVADRMRFLHGDLFTPIRDVGLAGKVGCIVANPPYVAKTDFPSLMPEVRDNEPEVALKAGPNGLDVYKRIATEAGDVLLPGGLLMLEIGFGQCKAVTGLLVESGSFSKREVHKDFQDIDRVIVAKRR